jgi:hypothetical protein
MLPHSFISRRFSILFRGLTELPGKNHDNHLPADRLLHTQRSPSLTLSPRMSSLKMAMPRSMAQKSPHMVQVF